LQLRKLTTFYHYYKIPLRIAQEIIMAYRPTTLAGSHPVPSYLINMPYLFEDYIRREIIRRVKEKQCGTEGLRVVEKQEYKLFQQEDSSTTCIPDLVVAEANEKRNKVVFVGDMKYYKGPISPAAYYQMLAYCHRFSLNTGMIICAHEDKRELTYKSESESGRLMVSVEPVKLFAEVSTKARDAMATMSNELDKLTEEIAKQAKKNF
jgi:5-methylcytosine-specific restriction endonuclease McrBC regulatory subunit McrC